MPFLSTVNVLVNLSILEVNFNGFTSVKLNVSTVVLTYISLFSLKWIKSMSVDVHDARNLSTANLNGRKPIHQNQTICFLSKLTLLLIQKIIV